MLTPSEEKPKRKYNKKVKVELAQSGPPEEVLPDATSFGYQSPRYGNGFLKSVPLPLKPNGLIDWRKLISKEHITLNRMALAQKGTIVDGLSKDDFAKLVEESPEEDLLIKLAGFREVAAIRGIQRLDSQVVNWTPESVAIKVTIEWIPNWEFTGNYEKGPEISAIASASIESTDDVFRKFLETIAENRAFVRCVRHSLGILSLGQDEFKLDDLKESQVDAQTTKIQGLLSQEMDKIGMNIVALKDLFEKSGFEWNPKWISVEKIDQAAAMILIPMIKDLN